MAKFVIAPHMRLHEWVADDKGYFKREGLDYEFSDQLLRRTADCTISATRSAPTRPSSADATPTSAAPATGRSTSPPRRATASCTPTPTRSRRRPCSCRPNPPITRPEQLAGVPISVGYQSGSHYSTIQALEQYLPARRDQALLRRRPAVPAHGEVDRPRGAGRLGVQRPLLLPRAARLPQDHRLPHS